MKKSFRLLLLCLLPLSLSGCVTALVGAGAFGVMSATDRRQLSRLLGKVTTALAAEVEAA